MGTSQKRSQRLGIRGLQILIFFVTVTQFMNCAQKDAESITDGPSGVLNTLSLGESGTYLNPKLDPPQMECTQDHIQIGGVCEDNGAEDSYIEYSLSRDRVPIPWVTANQQIQTLREARCENGRYFMIIPRPEQDTVISPNDTTRCYRLGCWAEYQVNSRMFAKKKGSNQYDLLYTAPALNIAIQLILFDGTNRYCPQ